MWEAGHVCDVTAWMKSRSSCQADRQANKKTDEQRERQTGDRHMSRRTDRETESLGRC